MLRTNQRTPAAIRVQRELAELAICAQVLQNRLANMGHTGLARRVATASLEMAHVVIHIGAATDCPGFDAHFTQVRGGRVTADGEEAAMPGP